MSEDTMKEIDGADVSSIHDRGLRAVSPELADKWDETKERIGDEFEWIVFNAQIAVEGAARNLKRNKGLRFGVPVTAAVAFINTACSNENVPVHVIETENEVGAPNSDNLPTLAPLAESTQSQEPAEREPVQIDVNAYIEVDPMNDSSYETIKFNLDENVLGGENPLIREGELLGVRFNLETPFTIQELKITQDGLYDTGNDDINLSVNATEVSTFTDAGSIFPIIVKSGETPTESQIEAKEKARETAKKIEIRTGKLSADAPLSVVMFFPNENIAIDGKEINPAERFAEGEVEIQIKRMGDLEQGTTIGTIDLAATDFQVVNANGDVLGIDPDIEIGKPKVIEVNSNTNTAKSPSEVTITVLDNENTEPDRVIVVESDESLTSNPSHVTVTPLENQPDDASTPENQTTEPIGPGGDVVEPMPEEFENETIMREDSYWTETEWEVNQTIPLREWVDNMIANGHITVRGLVPEEVAELINSYDLVPIWDAEDHDFIENRSYFGTLREKLLELRSVAGDSFNVSVEALELIPGDGGLFGNQDQVQEQQP